MSPPQPLLEKPGSINFSIEGGIFSHAMCCLGWNFNPCHDYDHIPDNFMKLDNIVSFSEEPGPGGFKTAMFSTILLPNVIIFGPLSYYQNDPAWKQDYKGIKFTLNIDRVQCSVNVKHLFDEDDQKFFMMCWIFEWWNPNDSYWPRQANTTLKRPNG